MKSLYVMGCLLSVTILCLNACISSDDNQKSNTVSSEFMSSGYQSSNLLISSMSIRSSMVGSSSSIVYPVTYTESTGLSDTVQLCTEFHGPQGQMYYEMDLQNKGVNVSSCDNQKTLAGVCTTSYATYYVYELSPLFPDAQGCPNIGGVWRDGK